MWDNKLGCAIFFCLKSPQCVNYFLKHHPMLQFIVCVIQLYPTQLAWIRTKTKSLLHEAPDGWRSNSRSNDKSDICYRFWCQGRIIAKCFCSPMPDVVKAESAVHLLNISWAGGSFHTISSNKMGRFAALVTSRVTFRQLKIKKKQNKCWTVGKET